MFNASFMYSRTYRLSLSPRTCLSLSLEPALLMRTRSFVLGWVEFLTGIFFYSAIHNM